MWQSIDTRLCEAVGRGSPWLGTVVVVRWIASLRSQRHGGGRNDGVAVRNDALPSLRGA